MARFHGIIGFEKEQMETEPGVYEPSGMEEKLYFGKIVKHFRRWERSSDGPNDNLVLSNKISILCDAYMNEHWPAIKYVQFGGVNWKVESAEIERPRILLTLGGAWNGRTA